MHDGKEERLVIAVLDLIAHRLQVEDVRPINTHETVYLYTSGLSIVCLGSASTVMLRKARRHLSQRRHIDSSEGKEEEDAGGEGGTVYWSHSIRTTVHDRARSEAEVLLHEGSEPWARVDKGYLPSVGSSVQIQGASLHQLWTEAGGVIVKWRDN